jgi:multiple sugar transport system substrate-binding protein
MVFFMVATLSTFAGGGQDQAPKATAPAATSAPQQLIEYNLLAGKPFAGQTVKVLCTSESIPQFMAIRRQVPEFERLTGIKVIWEYTVWDAWQEKFIAEATTGGGNYDILTYMDSYVVGVKNYLVPLQDLIARDKIDMTDYAPGFVEMVRMGDKDKIYGLPFRGHANLLYYNKAVFDELGLTPPKTWDELIATAKLIEQKKPGMKGLAQPYGGSSGQNIMNWLGILWSNGSDIFDAEYKPIFNNAAGVAATEMYVGFLTKDKIVAPGSVAFSEGEANNEVLQGRAAMNICWSWVFSKYSDPKQAIPSVLNKVAVAPVPGFPGKPAYTYSTSLGISISKDSRNQGAAWEYLKYQSSRENEKKIVIDKSDPAYADVITMHNSNLLDPEVNAANNNLHKMIYEGLKTSRGLPAIPQWLQIQSILEVAMSKMASGANVKATLDAAAKDVSAVMERAGYYKK